MASYQGIALAIPQVLKSNAPLGAGHPTFEPLSLSARIASDPHHRRTQQPLLIFVAALQFVEDVVIRDFARIHHLNGFVNPRIEGLPHRNNRLHSDFLQRILELTVDKLNAIAEVSRFELEFESPPAFSARSKLSRIGRKFLMTSAAANSRNSCCSRTARLRALSNSACRRARRSRSASRSALSFSVSDAALSSAALPVIEMGPVSLRLPQREAPDPDPNSLQSFHFP